MEGPARVAVEPGADLVLFVRSVIVEDHMDCLVRRHLALDAVEEADELLMAVALHVLRDSRAVQHVEGSEERRCAVPLVVVCHRAGAALLHWQAGLGSVEGLDLRLLVDRQHHGMGQRIDIQANDGRQLLGEGRVVGELEVPPAMRAETVGLPDTLHRRRCNAGDLGHRAQRPMGRLMRRRSLRQADDLGDMLRRDRRLSRRTGPVAQQSIDAFVHEPLLPAPDTGLGLVGLGHDGRGAQTIAAQKDNTHRQTCFCGLPGAATIACKR